MNSGRSVKNRAIIKQILGFKKAFYLDLPYTQLVAIEKYFNNVFQISAVAQLGMKDKQDR